MQTLIPSAEQILKEKQPYAYWLGNIPGIGSKTILHLLDEFSYPDEIYQASESSLQKLLKPSQLKNLLSSRECDIHSKYQLFNQKKIGFLPIYHPAYPKRFRNIPDPPYCIYYRGTIPSQSMPLIAIIGARNCSEYGRKTAIEFTNAFCSAGIGIVSGLARGIDGCAQEAAIKAGGKTYALLGSGVDICYPSENLALYRAIPKHGALISEYPPGTEPKAQFFPMRNRLISALCDVLLVIEAKEKSGTLITVDMALEQGKEVYAVPGRISDALSYGCNRLIKQGAGIALSPADVVSDLCEGFLGSSVPTLSSHNNNALLSDKEQSILHILDYQPKSVDSIYYEIKQFPVCHDLTLPLLMHTLTQLSLKGIIRNLGGAYCLSA